MQRGPPPIRNKINLEDAGHVRVWTRRLGMTADELKTVVSKVGDSVATVTKEIERQRSLEEPLEAAEPEKHTSSPFLT